MSRNLEKEFSSERHAQREIEERLYKVLVPAQEKAAISPNDFIDVYGADAVAKDMAYVRETEARFVREAEEDVEKQAAIHRGHLNEGIINDQIDSSDWLGPKARAIIPSRYDDIVNGIDSLVEFEEEGGDSYLGMGMDFTKESSSIREKLLKIQAAINKGVLSEVKYSPNARGPQFVPRVVVGADHVTFEDVAEKLLIFKQLQDRAKKEALSEGQRAELIKARNALGAHSLQFKILKEITMQLQVFQKYAENVGKSELAKIYEQTLGIIRPILLEKNKTRPDDSIIDGTDEVYMAIRDALASTFLTEEASAA